MERGGGWNSLVLAAIKMKTILHIEPSTFFVEFIKKKFNDSEYEYLSTDSYNEALILLE